MTGGVDLPLVGACGTPLAVGQRVRATAGWVARVRLSVNDQEADSLAAGGEIVTAITSPYWTAVTVQLDRPVRYSDGSGHDLVNLAADQLEVVT